MEKPKKTTKVKLKLKKDIPSFQPISSRYKFVEVGGMDM